MTPKIKNKKAIHCRDCKNNSLSISCQDLGQCRQQCCSPVHHVSLYYAKVTADDRKCTMLDPGTSRHAGQTPAVAHYLGLTSAISKSMLGIA